MRFNLDAIKNRPPHYYKKRAGKIISKVFIYALLIGFAFIFLLPLIIIVTKAPKGMADLLNPVINWLPTSIQWSNFSEAVKLLEMPRTLFISLFVSCVTTLSQVFMCALAGYSLGRYKYFGHKLIFVLVILCIIVPPQTVIISQYAINSTFGFINTLYPIIVPELFGHGLRGALFVLIFSQFFKNLSLSLEEAARIDGAGSLRLFLRIMLPLSKSAIVLVAIFSFVWHWNDTYSPTMFISRTELMTVMARFEMLFDPKFASMQGTGSFNTLEYEAIKMACALLALLPLLIFYLIFQKQFTEGIERTGLVE